MGWDELMEWLKISAQGNFFPFIRISIKILNCLIQVIDMYDWIIKVFGYVCV